MITLEDFAKRRCKAVDIFSLVRIDKVTAYEFVRAYHYLGDAKFFSVYAYGLFFGASLVGCATFSAPIS